MLVVQIFGAAVANRRRARKFQLFKFAGGVFKRIDEELRRLIFFDKKLALLYSREDDFSETQFERRSFCFVESRRSARIFVL